MVPDWPHITVSYKNIDHDSRGLDQTVHGYFRPDGSLRASLGRSIGSDAYITPFQSIHLWPQGREFETHIGRPV